MAATALSIYQAFTASILANDEQWKALLSEEVYLKGPLAEVQGKEDFITLNSPYFNSIQTMETRQLLQQGNTIATQITTTLLTPTGETIQFDVSEWYTFEDGKLKQLRVYFDSKALA
jgi:limonene-1,2-epoxide hydrolase